ncbi:hypothetical protein Cni_G04609 [Canna indica]|uniref:NAC domain-containing protein n=1 Tax=Canna indica TaxID=4628 RepID=A0AAQ3Q4M2_9LILI|nr:hypothetical protein Cni_G04609 [Canna indica]
MMANAQVLINKKEEEEEDPMDLPPGFRFHPTDEEIITHYLSPKLVTNGFSARAIGEVDLNKCEPWDLPSKAKMGGKEMYFFCHRDRKYPTGMRTNRATESGYWKATGKDKEIYRGKGVLVGMKKTLVFYKGRAPKGEKTNWVMHEFRLEGKFSLPNLPKSAKDEWVVSRVFHKNMGGKKSPPHGLESFGDDEVLLDSSNYLPPLMEPPPMDQYNYNSSSTSSFINNNSNIDDQILDFSTMMSMDQNQQVMMMMMMSSNNIIPSSSSSQVVVPPQNPYYLHHDEVMLRALTNSAGNNNYCKVESPDAGLSADRNTEISSSVDEPWTGYRF